MPLPGVYLVKPSARALQAASTATAGEGKSGSPAPKSTIDSPRALSSEARRETRSVADSPIEEARWESFTAADGIIGPLRCRSRFLDDASLGLAGGPLTSPALLSRLTPTHPGRGGRLQKKEFSLLFPTPSLPGA